jgi:hypothetical protein
MKRLVVGLACAGVLAALPAAAQEPFGPIRIDQEVRVTDESGRQVTGRIRGLTADSFAVGDRTFTASQVASIERKGDRLWNGVLIGAAVGAFLPLLPTEACFNQSGAGCVASGIETGALLGLLIDALHRGYTTIYVDHHAKGVTFAWRF